MTVFVIHNWILHLFRVEVGLSLVIHFSLELLRPGVCVQHVVCQWKLWIKAKVGHFPRKTKPQDGTAHFDLSYHSKTERKLNSFIFFPHHLLLQWVISWLLADMAQALSPYNGSSYFLMQSILSDIWQYRGHQRKDIIVRHLQVMSQIQKYYHQWFDVCTRGRQKFNHHSWSLSKNLWMAPA